MFAEAVSIDGSVLLLILVVFILMVALWCGLVVLGCVWAKRAGEGSRRALAGWALVAVAEAAPLVVSLSPLVLVAVAVLAVQARFYLRARAETTAADLP